MRAVPLACGLADPALTLTLTPKTTAEFETHVTGKTPDYWLDGAVHAGRPTLDLGA